MLLRILFLWGIWFSWYIDNAQIDKNEEEYSVELLTDNKNWLKDRPALTTVSYLGLIRRTEVYTQSTAQTVACWRRIWSLGGYTTGCKLSRVCPSWSNISWPRASLSARSATVHCKSTQLSSFAYLYTANCCAFTTSYMRTVIKLAPSCYNECNFDA